MIAEAKTAAETPTNYFRAIGRRKTAVASVRLALNAKPTIVVNGRELVKYFPSAELQDTVRDPFSKIKADNKFSVIAKITGGGTISQAEALRHGIARALVTYDGELRKTLKRAGLLKRDPRAKERRKFGLKKARKSPQWSKR